MSIYVTRLRNVTTLTLLRLYRSNLSMAEWDDKKNIAVLEVVKVSYCFGT